MAKMLRLIAEKLSRGRYLKRRLPSRFERTPLYVSPDSQLKYLRFGESGFDSELLRVIDEHIREDSVVWDIGANVGVFTFASASVAKKGMVLAVEADIWLAQLIRKSSQLRDNCGLSIRVLPCAISDRNGIATFQIARRGRASNTLEITGGRSQTGGIREIVTVPTLTLDTLLEFSGFPSFVKIDVEGAEAMVLNGAGRLLSEIRPTIYIEVGKVVNELVTSIFSKADYVLFNGSIPVRGQIPVTSCSFNTLAMPREKA
jgi:FkbM family methyltransferase